MSIIDYKKQYQGHYKRLVEDKCISKTNLQYAKDYLAYLDANNRSYATKSLFCCHLRKFLVHAPKDIKKLFDDKNAVLRVFSDIKNEGMAESTYYTIAQRSKTLVKWLNDDETPKAFKQIKVKKVKRDLKPSDMLTEKEIQILINSADDVQVKAMISMCLDAPIRPSELYDLKIGDIQKGRQFFRVYVDGKTGSRNLNLYYSIPELTNWLNSHPLKDDLNAPLWITRVGDKIKRPTYRGMTKRVETVFRRAKINKPCDFYILRHNANVRKKRDGVDPLIASRQSGHSLKEYSETYGRLAPEDEERALARAYGLEEKNKTPSVPTKCLCGHLNSADSSFCTNCGEGLSVSNRMKKQDDFEKMVRSDLKNIMRKELMKEIKRIGKN